MPHNNHPTPAIPTKNPTLKHQPTQNCATQVRARRGTVVRTAVRYVILAVSLLAASYLVLKALTTVGIPLGIAKILGDGAIYVASYVAQRRLVFTERG